LAKIGQNAQQAAKTRAPTLTNSIGFKPIHPIQSEIRRNESINDKQLATMTAAKSHLLAPISTCRMTSSRQQRRQLLGIQIKNCDPNLVAGYPQMLANCSAEHDMAPNGHGTNSKSESQLRATPSRHPNKQTTERTNKQSLNRIRCPRGGF